MLWQKGKSMCFYPSFGVFIQPCTGQIFLSVDHMPRTYWVLGTADGELIRQTEILALMERTCYGRSI